VTPVRIPQTRTTPRPWESQQGLLRRHQSTRESLGTSIARPGLTRRSNDILEKLSAWRRLPAGAASFSPGSVDRYHKFTQHPWRTSSLIRCVSKSLMLPAGEIPAPERGTSRPTGNRALGSWRQRHELSVGTSDERAVTQVKRLSLVMIVTRRPTASYWLEGNSRSPQEAMVTGDCGGVREHGTFGNGSIEEPERSTVVSARSGNEQSMLDEWNIPEKGKRCSGSRIRW